MKTTEKNLHVQFMPLGSIRPYEFNNRRHSEKQIERIAGSIKKYGFNQPIVIDETDTIIVGHGRFYAAQLLKLSEVPVVKKLGLDGSQKSAYRLLDNKLHEDSTWDFNNVELELGFLEDSGYDLEESGLSELNETINKLYEPPTEKHTCPKCGARF